MIKKYHLADLFTLLEVILACTLLIMAFFEGLTNYAIWVFIGGELCDALDGPCARRWHYPDDNKYRWWRHYNTEIDQASDILLAAACAIYIMGRVNTFFGFILAMTVLITCGSIELYVAAARAQYPRGYSQRKIDRLLLIRRCIYVFLGIGGAILMLIWHTSWPSFCKWIAVLILAIAAIVLSIIKRNRLTQVNTPL